MRSLIAALPLITATAAEARTVERVAPAKMREHAPALADYTDEVLFGDLWRRPDLAPRDRSLVTISALVAMGKTAQFEPHLRRALDNGVTPAEVSEIVTHLAFYAGWPAAVSAIDVVDTVMTQRESGTAPPQSAARVTVVPPGTDPQPGPAETFTGSVSAASRFKGDGGSRLSGATVTFQPGARTHWHSHPLGQLLVITAGEGRVQDRGGALRVIRAGDTVWTAPGVEHWHGAAPDAAMSHVAIAEAAGGKVVSWGDPVPESAYRAPASR